MLEITKRSPLTGEYNTMILDVTEEQIARWKSGTLIQDAMPHLNNEEREFLITGYTQSDWDTIPDEEE